MKIPTHVVAPVEAFREVDMLFPIGGFVYLSGNVQYEMIDTSDASTTTNIILPACLNHCDSVTSASCQQCLMHASHDAEEEWLWRGV